MNEKDWPRARRLVQALDTSRKNLADRRQIRSLADILNWVNARPEEVRSTQRQYTARLLEYTWVGYGELEQMERPWWQRWLPHPAKGRYAEDRQAILGVYWWLQIVDAREKGQLPAWEGIRIVRERQE